MGTDIHLHIEIKFKDAWYHYAQLQPERDYSVFAKMAGIRCEAPLPIVKPRGLPFDVTIPTRIDWYHQEGDSHDASWFNAEEIAKLSAYFESERRGGYFENWIGIYLYGNGFARFKKHPKDYPETVEDIRFVFWFDN